MSTKSEKGMTGIDIAISIVIITIFIATIGNLIVNINLNSKNIERRNIAISYAIQEIEKIKAQGYIEIYNDKGLRQEDLIKQEDIKDKNGRFSGYNKNILIKDYTLIVNDNTKMANILKKITVKISYKIGNKEQNVEISTYVNK